MNASKLRILRVFCDRRSTLQALSHGTSVNESLSFAAPDHSGNQGHHTRHAPDDEPDTVEWDAYRLRGLVVIGDRTQCPTC